MARFCTTCGHQLPAPDALCPVCAGNSRDSLRADTSGDGHSKRTSRKGSDRRKKRRHIVTGLIAGLVTILAVAAGTLALLVHFRVFDLPLVNPPQALRELSDARISVQRQDGDGEEATFVVTLPDFTALYQEAMAADDPAAYVRSALERGDYRIKRVTTTVHSSSDDADDAERQAIDGVLEQELEDAIDSIAGASND